MMRLLLLQTVLLAMRVTETVVTQVTIMVMTVLYMFLMTKPYLYQAVEAVVVDTIQLHVHLVVKVLVVFLPIMLAGTITILPPVKYPVVAVVAVVVLTTTMMTGEHTETHLVASAPVALVAFICVLALNNNVRRCYYELPDCI